MLFRLIQRIRSGYNGCRVRHGAERRHVRLCGLDSSLLDGPSWSAAQELCAELPVERLEARVMMAGNVRVRFTTSGDLMVFGDGADNRIRIDIAPSGKIRVKGLAPLNSGGYWTTVEGSGEYIVPGTLNGKVKDDLRIMMRGGNDFVEIQDITVEDSMTVVASGGDDSVAISDVVVKGVSRIVGGGGNDVVLIKQSQFGYISYMGGGGHDFLGWNETRAGGDVRFVGGGGVDAVFMGNSNINANVSFVTGGPSDVAYIVDTSFNGAFTARFGGADDTIALDGVVDFGGFVDVRGDGQGQYGDALIVAAAMNFPRARFTNFENTFRPISALNGFESWLDINLRSFLNQAVNRGFDPSYFPIEL